MARPKKQGLDYFTNDVNFYQDIKIRKLIHYKGIQAVSIYHILLCQIYASGYYLPWDDDLPFIISEISGLQEDSIPDMIRYFIEIGLFDKSIFEENRVLTSRSIQERYFEICSLLHRIFPENLPYLLIKTSNNRVSSDKTRVSSEETPISSEETPISSEETPVSSEKSTQIKEKKIKVKHSSSVLQCAGAHTHTHTREGEAGVVDLWEQNDRQLFADVDKEIALLHNSPIWKEQVLMRYKFLQQNEKILDELIDKWGSEMKISSKKHHNLNDLRMHFNYCLQKLETDSIKNAKANGTDDNNGYRSREDLFNSAVRIIGELRSEGKKTLSDLPEV